MVYYASNCLRDDILANAKFIFRHRKGHIDLVMGHTPNENGWTDYTVYLVEYGEEYSDGFQVLEAVTKGDQDEREVKATLLHRLTRQVEEECVQNMAMRMRGFLTDNKQEQSEKESSEEGQGEQDKATTDSE